MADSLDTLILNLDQLRLQLQLSRDIPMANSPMFHPTLPILYLDHHVEEGIAMIVGYEEEPESYYDQDQPTYEENLEQMGRVDSSRLSEETIMRNLKITSYDGSASETTNEEPDICVICQGEYEKDELIGGLHCRHEYHVQCVNKWLQQRNCCPICKADAVNLSSSPTIVYEF